MSLKKMEKRGPIVLSPVVLLRELGEVWTAGVPCRRFECDRISMRRTTDKDGEVS